MADINAFLSQLSPEERQSLASALTAPADAPPVELSPEEQELAAKQEEVANLAGSEQAATDPGSVAAQINQLHSEITVLQEQLGHSTPVAALSDRIQSLEIKVANLERAQPSIGYGQPGPAS